MDNSLVEQLLDLHDSGDWNEPFLKPVKDSDPKVWASAHTDWDKKDFPTTMVKMKVTMILPGIAPETVYNLFKTAKRNEIEKNAKYEIIDDLKDDANGS